ncbi:polysaccharide biosynthesis/export family protein [Dysgonomonas sp. ZJ279]|uniref:polysaccharide biosynthesis/export family protein n=1 Tax=Dysgonomonas sp. ZJ279 TaxID=2709796 RepID=UPI0013EBDCC0|nr:polysaccharide biosynthesis/export family protein [Dysgonomonas sp. ZJ279]
MKFVLKKFYWILFVSMLLTSCNSYKTIPYLTEAESISSEEFAKVAKKYEATIMPNDILTITVNTPTNKASLDFNLPLVPQEASDLVQSRVSSAAGGYGSLQNYIVEKDGCINFPVLGKLKIGGLTKQEAQQKISSMIYPQYLKEEPIVSIRFLNYKVAVFGEVTKPGVYSFTNEQVTILEALATAGDLTIYGRRDNIMLIREDADGFRSVKRIDLQNKDVLLENDIYYLQQNDKLYIEPNKARARNSQIGSVETLTATALISGLSLIITIVSVITR